MRRRVLLGPTLRPGEKCRRNSATTSCGRSDTDAAGADDAAAADAGTDSEIASVASAAYRRSTSQPRSVMQASAKKTIAPRHEQAQNPVAIGVHAAPSPRYPRSHARQSGAPWPLTTVTAASTTVQTAWASHGPPPAARQATEAAVGGDRAHCR